LLFSMTESQGKTLVLVTHDPDLAGRCQRLVRIQNGLLEAVE
jgi:putative ABC transport system ATP-binding protein